MDAEMAAMLVKMREDIDLSRREAGEAKLGVAKHEELCSLRYENISKQLDTIPQIFIKIDNVAKDVGSMGGRLNLATGIWMGALGIGSIVGIIASIVTVLRSIHPVA